MPDLAMPRRLDGDVIFVTGGGSGIGEATARRLTAEGASVAVGDVRPGASDAVVQALDGDAVAVTCDVAHEHSMIAAVAATAEHFGKITGVVTCAGITLPGPTADVTLEQWNRVLGINLTGTFLAIREVLPHLLAAGGGAIVTIGSVASLVTGGSSASYDASKGAVLQLTRAVAAEYAKHNVRANCICPGVVRTGLTANSTAIRGEVTAEPPRKGLWVDVPNARYADPSEVASVAAFLLSSDASFVTGAALPVDGGFTAV